jgi:hypothetical protein
MEQAEVSTAIFNALHPHIMSALSITLATIYLYKYFCVTEPCSGSKRPIYFVRFIIWFLFGVAWAVFPYAPLVIARSVLRAFVALVLVSEISYNMYYIKDAVWDTWKWIYWKLFQTQL